MTSFRRYFAFARVAFREAAAARGELCGRGIFLVVVLGIFTALWRAIAEAGMPLSAERHQLVWYLAATEWVLLSAPTRHLEIQDEVRRGDVAYWLPRPAAYPRAAFAQCLGALAVRAPFLALVAAGSAWALTGALPNVRGLLWVFPFGLVAAAVLAELYVALGLLSFWLTDATPLYWVAGKLMFTLGGLMLPLELYPEWIQRVAWFTPFPSLLSGPAGFVLHGAGGAPWLLLALLAWGGLLFGLVELLFWRATRSLTLSGG